MTHLSFQREPALPLIMHTVTSACCVSTRSRCAVPDIFCQSFAAPTTPPARAHGTILSQVCVAFTKPQRPRLDSSLAALLSFSVFLGGGGGFINQWHTVDNLPRSGARWIFAGVLIFYIFTWTQILADLQSAPNCDPWELGEC